MNKTEIKIPIIRLIRYFIPLIALIFMIITFNSDNLGLYITFLVILGIYLIEYIIASFIKQRQVILFNKHEFFRKHPIIGSVIITINPILFGMIAAVFFHFVANTEKFVQLGLIFFWIYRIVRGIMTVKTLPNPTSQSFDFSAIFKEASNIDEPVYIEEINHDNQFDYLLSFLKSSSQPTDLLDLSNQASQLYLNSNEERFKILSDIFIVANDRLKLERQIDEADLTDSDEYKENTNELTRLAKLLENYY